MPGALTYAPLMLAFLRHRYAPARHAAKALARDAATSPRTAENWLNGHCAPSGESLLALMAANPGLEDALIAAVAARRAMLRDGSFMAAIHSNTRLARRRDHARAMDLQHAPVAGGDSTERG